MNISLKQQILSEENIYKAIYSIESYISEPELLEEKDLSTFLKLRDKYDFNGIIYEVINDCKTILGKLLEDNN